MDAKANTFSPLSMTVLWGSWAKLHVSLCRSNGPEERSEERGRERGAILLEMERSFCLTIRLSINDSFCQAKCESVASTRSGAITVDIIAEYKWSHEEVSSLALARHLLCYLLLYAKVTRFARVSLNLLARRHVE